MRCTKFGAIVDTVIMMVTRPIQECVTGSIILPCLFPWRFPNAVAAEF